MHACSLDLIILNSVGIVFKQLYMMMLYILILLMYEFVEQKQNSFVLSDKLQWKQSSCPILSDSTYQGNL